MVFKVPPYPDELTDKWWQKHKGAVAKIATREDGTGIGKQLTALQAAYKKINWDGLNYDSHWPGVFGKRTEDQIQQGIASSREVAKRADVVSKQARDVEIAAKNLAAAWSKEKLIPKSSTAAALKISQAAQKLSFALALGTLADVAKKGAEENRAGTKANQLALRKMVGKFPATMDTLINNLGNVTAVDQWAHFWSQDVRNTGTLLPKVQEAYPASAADIAEFKKACNHPNAPKDEQELARWIRELDRTARAVRAHLP